MTIIKILGRISRQQSLMAARTARPDTAATKPMPGKKKPIKKASRPKPDMARTISFIQLFKNGTRTDSKYVSDVAVTLMKKHPDKNVVGYVSKTVTRDDKGPPRRYQHYVIAQDFSREDGKQLWQSKAVKVSCQCSRFKFYYEYPLNRRGAADIVHSNGTPPLNTNPRLVPSVCKHLLAVMYAVLRKERG